ncbi:hypothetical protein MANES_17G011733v8 [Manihot esculenta]|uniref:Uncharacterized protein n=1 Tax=Manihot esculenta TaxID=3983 RepID=A0ACB7G1X0_MANES|nr:hypothetical protein MANES_17G011733v8 [Manihot esculenta]
MSELFGIDFSRVHNDEGNSDSIVYCSHGVRATMYISWMIRNPDHRFHRCETWKGNECSFFQWHDPPFTGQEREVMVSLVRKRSKLKEKVKSLEEMCNRTAEIDMIGPSQSFKRKDKEILRNNELYNFLIDILRSSTASFL